MLRNAILNTPQHILILGGSGFLSGTVARLAVSQGHHVTVITRGNKMIPQGVTALQVDRSDRTAFADKIKALDVTWDLVVDAIAFSPEDAQQDVDVFAGCTKRFVLVSTDFVYDPFNRSVPQLETCASYATQGYGGKKRQAELVLEQTDTTQLPWTVLRPSHIFGPGSLPGCLPMHGRDPKLIESILEQQSLMLVEGGRLLQHPVFAMDLAMTILSTLKDRKSIGKILNVAGPEVFESQVYYSTLGKLLDRDVSIESISVDEFLAANPDKAPFCCDRVYDLTALRCTQLHVPLTSLESGLRQMLENMQG
jgi:nucleoside-diphosphate-sugar epimerase